MTAEGQRPTTEASLPHTLIDAKSAVRNLPGASGYFTETPSEPELETGLSTMIEELIWQLDAENMRMLTPYAGGFQNGERRGFLEDPQTQPFQSKVELSSDPSERRADFLLIGTYLRLKFEESKRVDPVGEATRTAARTLATFHRYSVKNLFSEASFAVEDKMRGLDPQQRKDFQPTPSYEAQAKLKNKSIQIGKEMGIDPKALLERAIAASDNGSLDSAFDFLRGKKGDPALRRVLGETQEYFTSKPSYQQEKIALLWETVKFSMEMGIDWDTYLEINGVPPAPVLTDMIIGFLTDPKFTEETIQLLQKEAPNSYQKILNGQMPTYWEILHERAQFEDFSDKPEDIRELEMKWDRVFVKLTGISKLFHPFEFRPEGNYRVDARHFVGASPRGYDLNFHNSYGELVNYVFLNPRQPEKKLERQAAHELTHFMHEGIIQGGINSGDLPHGIAEKIPYAFKEDLAELVAEQIQRKPGDQKTGQFEDLDDAITARRQAPYTVIQQGIRQEMAEMWKQGIRHLSERQIRGLIRKFDPMTKEWYALGVPINFTHHNLATNVDILNWDDGLRYLAQYLVPKSEELSESENLRNLRSAFEERFGRRWIQRKNARIVLAGLLAETGTNFEYATFANFVRNADITEVSVKLTSWGIDMIQINGVNYS